MFLCIKYDSFGKVGDGVNDGVSFSWLKLVSQVCLGSLFAFSCKMLWMKRETEHFRSASFRMSNVKLYALKCEIRCQIREL